MSVFSSDGLPLAGVYPTSGEEHEKVHRFPLSLCECGKCGLLQITTLVDIALVFHDNYRYSTSTVPGLVKHFAEYAKWITTIVSPDAQILEIGCNDGTLLNSLAANKLSCTGVDASDNVASIARRNGHEVVTGFFSAEMVDANAWVQHYDLVTCSNMLAHIDDLSGTLEAIRLALRPRGLFAVEVHNAESLEQGRQFDTIYHEHLTYFTPTTLRATVEKHGFSLVEMHRTTMHGGGLRALFRADSRAVTVSNAKKTPGIGVLLRNDMERCQRQLSILRGKHGLLHGYGAAGRSQMFISMVGQNMFKEVYDDSPLRQGRFIAGTNVPINAYESQKGNCLVILAWNWADSIVPKVQGNFGTIVALMPEYIEYK